MASAAIDGSPSWIDLSTADVDAAKAFYGALLGWTFETVDGPRGDYHLAATAHGPVAGMGTPSAELAGGPSFWTVFFAVEDVDATVSKLKTAGGALLHAPMELSDGTRVVAVIDAAGAMLGLMSGSSLDPCLSESHGAVGWVELMTRTPTQSNRFYAEVFGWSTSSETAGEGLLYTVYTAGEQNCGGMIETPAHVPAEVPDNWSVYFSVDDCAAAEAKTIELGGSVLVSTTPTPMGPFAVLSDPQGVVFQVMQYISPANPGEQSVS